MADIAETLLPSGRAVRVEKLGIPEYRAAKRRAGEKGARNGTTYLDDLGHEMLLASLRGITAEPVMLVMRKVDGEDREEFDFDATLEAVPGASYAPCSYESLVTKGATSLSEVFKNDSTDYDAACLFARQVVTPASPLELMVAGKKRILSK